jgi:hypothetical protein
VIQLKHKTKLFKHTIPLRTDEKITKLTICGASMLRKIHDPDPIPIDNSTFQNK